MKLKTTFYLIALVAALALSSCGKDDPVIPNEEELITTLNYTLTPSDGGTPIILSFVDIDGDGPDAPVISGGTLEANKSYRGSMDLLNEAEETPESITEEISEEAEEHQFFFSSTVSGLSVAYADMDANGRPLGLSNTLTTGAAGSGNLTIVLRHEPMKDAAGVADGEEMNAGGEIDISVTFPIDVI